VFSVDQLSERQTNTGKFGKWFPGNHFPENKHSLFGMAAAVMVEVEKKTVS